MRNEKLRKQWNYIFFLWPSLAPQMLMGSRRRWGGGGPDTTVQRRLCLSMQRKYLHKSNEYFSPDLLDTANFKLALQNICNFVAKKQRRKRKKKTPRENEIRVSFTHLRFAIPPPNSIRNSSSVSSPRTDCPRGKGPSRAANLAHRVLFMVVIPWKTPPFPL